MNKSIDENKNNICAICGAPHNTVSCDFASITGYMSNEKAPTRAQLSLPKEFSLYKLADGRSRVVTNKFIDKGTRFGPLEAVKTITLNPSIQFPLKVFPFEEEDYLEYYLDTANEETSTWMIFVEPAENLEEQNLICYQEEQYIYYLSIKNINETEALKVWYAPYYAKKMGKKLLEEKYFEVKTPDEKVLDNLVKSKQNIPDVESWSCRFCAKSFNEIRKFAHHLIQEHYKGDSRKKFKECERNFKPTRGICRRLVKNANNDEKKLLKSETRKFLEDQNNYKEISIGGPLLNSISSLDNLDNSDFIMPTLCQLTEDTQIMGVENLNTENLLMTENFRALEYFNFEIEEDKEEEIVCDICCKSFSQLSYLIQHLKGHRGDYYCSSCNKVFSRKENLTRHSCNINATYPCNLCNRTFSQKKYHKWHVNTAHNNKFECENCHKNYANKFELKQHNCKATFNSRHMYVCNVCHKIFSQQRYLKKHIGRCHEGEKSYVCEICSKEYTMKVSYEVHALTHKEPQFECEVCHRRFHRNDTLKEHILNVHINQELRCDVCSKTFKSKKYLMHHRKSHEKMKYYCSVCKASFKTKSNLTRHSKTHRKECISDKNLVHQCNHCGKKMKLSSSLIRHIQNKHTASQESKEEANKVEIQFLGDSINLITDSQDNIDLMNDEEMNELEREHIQVVDNFLLKKSEEMGLGMNNFVLRLNDSKLKGIERREVLSMPDLMEVENNLALDDEEFMDSELS